MLVVASAIMLMVAGDLFMTAVNDSRFIPPVVEGWAESTCRHLTPETMETEFSLSGKELPSYNPDNPRGCLDAHRREPFQGPSDVTDEEIREMFDRLEE